MRKIAIIANNFAWFIGIMIVCVKLNKSDNENRRLKMELNQCREEFVKANTLIKKANDVMSSPALLIVYW